MSNFGFSVKGIRKVFIHLTEKLFVLINMMWLLAKLLVFQSIYVTVQFDNLGILLADNFTQQSHLFRHVL